MTVNRKQTQIEKGCEAKTNSRQSGQVKETHANQPDQKRREVQVYLSNLWTDTSTEKIVWCLSRDKQQVEVFASVPVQSADRHTKTKTTKTRKHKPKPQKSQEKQVHLPSLRTDTRVLSKVENFNSKTRSHPKSLPQAELKKLSSSRQGESSTAPLRLPRVKSTPTTRSAKPAAGTHPHYL